MNLIAEYKLLLAGISAYLACIGCGLVYGLRGKNLWVSGIGGALGWITFTVCNALFDSVLSYFIATLALSVFSEIMSRVLKQPATVFLSIALLPLVPGAGIYFTMRAFVDQDMTAFAINGSNTLSIAGMLALGVLVISTISRIFLRPLHHRKQR